MATNTTKEYAFMNEVVLSVNAFKEVTTEKGLNGLALNIRNLLLTRPNTYPSDPDYGVGIQDYRFETITETVLSEITQKIKEQQNTYIPSENIYEIRAELLPTSNSGIKTLGVLVTLRNGENIAVTFEQNKSNMKVVSQIYV